MPKSYRHRLYLKPLLIALFNFSHKRPTFAFTGESGYTLGFRRKIAHSGPHAETGTIHIDTFHDYEPCILARYLKEIPEFYSQLDDQFIAEHGLSDLMDVVNSVPSLRTDYVPRDSIVREFVGGSCFEY